MEANLQWLLFLSKLKWLDVAQSTLRAIVIIFPPPILNHYARLCQRPHLVSFYRFFDVFYLPVLPPKVSTTVCNKLAKKYKHLATFWPPAGGVSERCQERSRTCRLPPPATGRLKAIRLVTSALGNLADDVDNYAKTNERG